MKETLKLGLVLLLFTAVSAGVLAFTNGLTAPIIAEHERQASFEAFGEMFSEADDFQELDEAKFEELTAAYPDIKEVHEALKGSESVGYAFKVISGGYGGDITTVAGINSDGSFAGIKIVDNSETPNLGDKIKDEPFTSSFIGKTVAEALKPVASPQADNEVLLLSGATISSNGVAAGVNKTREAFIEFLADGSIEVAEEEDPKESIFEEGAEFNEVENLGEISGDYAEVVGVEEVLVDGDPVAYVFEVVTKGYGGDMHSIIGINMDGTIAGVRLGENGETSGLGDRVGEEEFTSQFEGKSITEDISVDTITGATVSSKAMLSGIDKAKEAFTKFFAN